MPEAVIVVHRPLPDRPGQQGLAEGPAARRPDRARSSGRRSTRCPALDPHTVDDLYLGCGLPGGESGNNMAPGRQRAQRHGRRPRRHASPATARRRCRPRGWPSTRSRPARATCSSPPASRPSRASPRAPPTTGPTPRTRVFADAEARTEKTAEGGQDWHDPREDGDAPRHLHRDGPDRRERRPAARPVAARSSTSSASARQNLAEKAIADGFWAREITPVTLARRHAWSRPTTARAPGVTYDAVAELKPVFRPDGVVTAGNCCAAQRRRRRGRGHVRHQGRRARPHPAGPDRRHRRHRPLPGDHGPRPGRGDQAARSPTPA